MASSKITTKDLSEPVVEALNTIDTVADQITEVDSNVDILLNRLTDTRASNLDLLSNSTNGLAAIKTAITNVNTTISNSSGQKYATAGDNNVVFNLSEGVENPDTNSVTHTFVAPRTGLYRVKLGGRLIQSSGTSTLSVKIAASFSSPSLTSQSVNTTVSVGTSASGKTFTMNDGEVFLEAGNKVTISYSNNYSNKTTFNLTSVVVSYNDITFD